MEKPFVFIGSSLEAKPIAREIQEKLLDTCTCQLWDEALFEPGEAALYSLHKALPKFDFAIFIFNPDDITESRENKYISTRDNVIFELGLSMGILGIRRSFIVVPNNNSKKEEIKIKIPSDLAGITYINFDWDGKTSSLNYSLGAACNILRKSIIERSKELTLSMLPSTSLAQGYFKNFVLEICAELIKVDKVEIGGKNFDLSKDIFDFTIVLPDDISTMGHPGVNKFKRENNLIDFEIPRKSRPFPFYVKQESVNGRVKFYDFPTTLRASSETINLIYPPGMGSSNREFLGQKELRNFEKILKFLLTLPEAAEFRDNIKIISYSDLGINTNIRLASI